MEKRKEFVLKALSRTAPITQLCDEYGISRKTGYKWIARFKQQGFDGLVDETRRPNGSANPARGCSPYPGRRPLA